MLVTTKILRNDGSLPLYPSPPATEGLGRAETLMSAGGAPAMLLDLGAGHARGCICKARSCVGGELTPRQTAFCFQRVWFGGSGVKV